MRGPGGQLNGVGPRPLLTSTARPPSPHDSSSRGLITHVRRLKFRLEAPAGDESVAFKKENVTNVYKCVLFLFFGVYILWFYPPRNVKQNFSLMTFGPQVLPKCSCQSPEVATVFIFGTNVHL